MFNSKIKLNSIKIGNVNFEILGLYLEKDYIFTLPPLRKEYEEVPRAGRNGSLTKFKRYLNREFTVTFKVKDSKSYFDRMFNIQDVLDRGGIITINNEKVGYKLKRYDVESLEVGTANNTMSIKFVCEPFLYKLDGTVIEGR